MRFLFRARLSVATRRSLVLVFGLLCAVQAAAPPPAHAQEAAALPAPLDGLRFVGPFGAEGERDPKQDTFTFKDGKFATASCLEWGFTPAPFWTRRDAKGLHFLAELKSPDHGTMRYQGTFDGKRLTVTGFWKKERWYWTVERTYHGSGRLPAAAK